MWARHGDAVYVPLIMMVTSYLVRAEAIPHGHDHVPLVGNLCNPRNEVRSGVVQPSQARNGLLARE